VKLGIIGIHADNDVTKEVFIITQSVNVDNHKAKYLLREGWEGLNYSLSHIDQVKLYAVDSYGNRHLCPLINAKHAKLGNVLPQLLLSDNVRCDLNLLETISLEFLVPYQTDEIQDFIFVIEGYNAFKQ